MVWLLRVVILCGILEWPASPARGQEPPTVEPTYEFVSGTITDLPEGKIVVNRAVLGKPAENRTFLITSETKIEGKLRTHARVTVGFKPSEEGDVAMRIIVRSGQPENQKKP